MNHLPIFQKLAMSQCLLCKEKRLPSEYFSTCLQCEKSWCLDCDAKINTNPCPYCHTSPFVTGTPQRIDEETALALTFPSTGFPVYLPLDDRLIPFVHVFSWETKRRIYPKPSFYWILREWWKVQGVEHPETSGDLRTCRFCTDQRPKERFAGCLKCGQTWCSNCDAQLRGHPCPSCRVQRDAFAMPDDPFVRTTPPPRPAAPPSYESVVPPLPSRRAAPPPPSRSSSSYESTAPQVRRAAPPPPSRIVQ